MKHLTIILVLYVISSSYALFFFKPFHVVIVPKKLVHHPHVRYAYNYDVSDSHTGDKKTAWEKRIGNTVKGSYSLVEPDGQTRIVDYVAGKGGFNAIVKRVGPKGTNVQIAASSVSEVIADPRAPSNSPSERSSRSKRDTGSLPWNPVSRSYGGWEPNYRPSRRSQYITIIKRKDGKKVFKVGPLKVGRVKRVTIRKRSG